VWESEVRRVEESELRFVTVLMGGESEVGRVVKSLDFEESEVERVKVCRNLRRGSLRLEES
jgi:hypothetical protein